jgi:hypothetical protein
LKVIAFVGPTLSPGHCEALLPGVCVVPPVACGDVARSVQERPDAIAIVDGFFHQHLAVWHKEILWALSNGVRVYGAASMGALRAAELADFGMIGVGRVFEWFRDGVLEDDDEVAIIHDPADRGYVARSEALVNVRATLEVATTGSIVSRTSADAVIDAGKKMFFADRTFPAILDAAEAHASAAGDDRADISQLRQWLLDPSNRIDQKREDAETLFRRIGQDLAETRAPEPPSFVFQYTEAWHELTRRLFEHER